MPGNSLTKHGDVQFGADTEPATVLANGGGWVGTAPNRYQIRTMRDFTMLPAATVVSSDVNRVDSYAGITQGVDFGTSRRFEVTLLVVATSATAMSTAINVLSGICRPTVTGGYSEIAWQYGSKGHFVYGRWRSFEVASMQTRGSTRGQEATVKVRFETASPWVYSTILQTSTIPLTVGSTGLQARPITLPISPGTVTASTAGVGEPYWTIEVTGVANNPAIYVVTAPGTTLGQFIALGHAAGTGYVLSSGQTLIIDPQLQRIYRSGGADNNLARFATTGSTLFPRLNPTFVANPAPTLHFSGFTGTTGTATLKRYAAYAGLIP